ncbi:MAG TPA: hypothetical protein VK797_21985 [Tepidisphaeraceae bacterium]|jgi:hypothetical protein|nr:hypothetical protein [Tepidisphaeraceae bacterium]
MSGGYIANNLRQGYRAEYLARYILSEFGPCVRIDQENDYGIDLLGTLMKKVGTGGVVSSAYTVQVKSGSEKFGYGAHAMEWLRSFNLPVLMCRASRATNDVKLYSTWMIHHLILQDKSADIDSVEFIEEYGDGDKLKVPVVENRVGLIWLGKPIIQMSVPELSNEALVSEVVDVLSEWVELDAANYFRRNANLPVIYGYVQWETNKSMKTSARTFYKPYYFSDQRTVQAVNLIQECATVIALNKGRGDPLVKDLGTLIKTHGVDVHDFTKQALGIV